MTQPTAPNFQILAGLATMLKLVADIPNLDLSGVPEPVRPQMIALLDAIRAMPKSDVDAYIKSLKLASLNQQLASI